MHTAQSLRREAHYPPHAVRTTCATRQCPRNGQTCSTRQTREGFTRRRHGRGNECVADTLKATLVKWLRGDLCQRINQLQCFWYSPKNVSHGVLCKRLVDMSSANESGSS
eukprot:4654368-Pleurochrysis_carterae.AAC.1